MHNETDIKVNMPIQW